MNTSSRYMPCAIFSSTMSKESSKMVWLHFLKSAIKAF